MSARGTVKVPFPKTTEEMQRVLDAARIHRILIMAEREADVVLIGHGELEMVREFARHLGIAEANVAGERNPSR